MRRLWSGSLLAGTAALFAFPIAANAQEQGRAQASQSGEQGDIIVTARRRAENLQTVPVAITAFSSETLVAKGITNTDDLQRLTPGVIFTGAGGPLTTTYFIRGQGRDVIGSALPSVVNYLNEVPLIPSGSNLPAFDVGNIQILKGPQGTLFGRNTTGGAVLVYSVAPTHELTGYAQVLAGNFDWFEAQGAINVPIVPDVLAVRLAGNIARRDGYSRQQRVGPDQDQIHADQFRASVLLEPNDTISNTTVFDYNRSNGSFTSIQPTGYVSPFLIYKQGLAQAVFGDQLGTLIADAYDCDVSIACDVDLQIERQLEAGPRKLFYDSPGLSNQTIWGVSNTTTIEIGEITLKNIFGYRSQSYRQLADSDGLELPMFRTDNFQHERQITEEIQLSGKALNEQLDWLVGAFYLDNKPTGTYGARFDTFRPPQIPQDAWPLSSVQNTFYKDRSKAIFGNLDYKFAGGLSGLGISLGARYTWDREAACSFSTFPFNTPALDGWKACLDEPLASNASQKFKKFTWQAAVNYEIGDVFLYATARTGYRAGQLNTPVLAGVLTQFQAYKPQTVQDYEIGIKTQWQAGSVRGIFNIAAFRSTIKDYQRQISGIPPGIDGDTNPLNDPSFTSLVVNGGKARLQGIEIDGSVSPFQDLTFNFAGSYLDAKFLTLTTPAALSGQGGSLPTFDKSPKWSYSVGADWRLPLDPAWGEIHLTADHYWLDKYFASLVVFPSHSVTNASLQWRNISGSSISATAFVNNLTDETYPSFSALTGASPGFSSLTFAPPRTYGLRLRYDF